LELSDKGTASQLDRAYACFGFIGLAILTTAALGALAGKDPNNQLGVFIFVLVPMSLTGLAAFAYGVVLTIKLRRLTLVALNVTSLFFVAVMIAFDANAEPEPRPFNAVLWDPHTPCSTGWTAQENLFIKSDGSKLPGCVDMEDIQRTGKVLMLPDPNLRIDSAFQPPVPVLRPSHKVLSGLGVALACIFPAINILIPAWWFTVDRRRYLADRSET
jgi:hypothetical protein